MKLFAITVAYCNAATLARSLILYRKYRAITPYRHVVALCRYPINTAKNENDIRLICDAIGDIEVIDLGKDIGSAQSQNAVLSQLDITDDDVWINLDADSACCQFGWDEALIKGLEANPDAALISCMAPMIARYRQGEPFNKIYKSGRLSYGIPNRPTPFNLSAFRQSFVREIGGLRQGGLQWGELEGVFWGECQRRGKFHAYLLDYMEDENGKFMQDRQQGDYKNLHMRTTPDKQFLGNFSEYLRWKHPALAELDTCKNLLDNNHP